MYSSVLKCRRMSNLDSDYYTDLITLPVSQQRQLYNKFVSGKGLTFFVKNNNAQSEAKLLSLCRVAKFEGTRAILPGWMMDKCQIEDEDEINVTEVIVPNAKSVDLEPHNRAMMEEFITGAAKDLDVSQTLAAVLSNYGTFTNNSTIEINILGTIWKVNVKDLKDCKDKVRNGLNAINIDLETNLLPALDEPKQIALPIVEETIKPLLFKSDISPISPIDPPLPISPIDPPLYPGQGRSVSSDVPVQLTPEEMRNQRLRALGAL